MFPFIQAVGFLSLCCKLFCVRYSLLSFCRKKYTKPPSASPRQSKMDEGQPRSCDTLHTSPVIATLGTRNAHRDHHNLDLEERNTLDARPVNSG